MAGGAPKPQPPTPAEQAKQRAARKRVPVRRISVRRLKHGLACKLTLGSKAGVKSLNAWLIRNDRTVSAASVKHVRGREHVSLRLPSKRRLRKGHYELVVQAVDGTGEQTYKRQRLVLR